MRTIKTKWRAIATAPRTGRVPIWLKIVNRSEPQAAFSDTWWMGGWSVECTPTHWKPRSEVKIENTPDAPCHWNNSEASAWQAGYEAAIDTLREDKRRLDWLEAQGELQHLYEEGRPDETIPVISVPAFNFDFDDMSLSQAIDKAMSAQNKPKP